MAKVTTCPSGLQGRVRGMKVREEIGRDRAVMLRIGCRVKPLLFPRYETVFVHESHNFLFADGLVAMTKLAMNTRTTVSTLVLVGSRAGRGNRRNRYERPSTHGKEQQWERAPSSLR